MDSDSYYVLTDVLKHLAFTITVLLGLLAVFGETRNKETNKVNLYGWLTVSLIGVAAAIGAVTTNLEGKHATAERDAAESRQVTITNGIMRSNNPFSGSVKISGTLWIPIDEPSLQSVIRPYLEAARHGTRSPWRDAETPQERALESAVKATAIDLKFSDPGKTRFDDPQYGRSKHYTVHTTLNTIENDFFGTAGLSSWWEPNQNEIRVDFETERLPGENNDREGFRSLADFSNKTVTLSVYRSPLFRRFRVESISLTDVVYGETLRLSSWPEKSYRERSIGAARFATFSSHTAPDVLRESPDSWR